MSELLPPFAPPVDHPHVVYQGVAGAFSDGACMRWFGRDVDRQGLPHFHYVVEAVEEGRADYGVLPIENTSTGSITDVYDLLYAHPACRIVGELTLEITQNLLVVPGTKLEDVKRVYSHPQGLGQSARFLTSHGMEACPYADTASAARYVAQEKPEGAAAIASRQAAEVYGLDILVPHVNFNGTNRTRFVVIRNVPEMGVAQNKASIVFKTAHRPGALYGALRYFAEGRFDMTRIESRPVVGKPWEYAFYIDLLGFWNDAHFRQCLEKVAAQTEDFHLLGVYRSADDFNYL